MAPFADPADIVARRGDAAAHLATWFALALFVLSLLAIWDERRRATGRRPDRCRLGAPAIRIGARGRGAHRHSGRHPR